MRLMQCVFAPRRCLGFPLKNMFKLTGKRFRKVKAVIFYTILFIFIHEVLDQEDVKGMETKLKGKVYSLYNSSWDNKTIADSPERQVVKGSETKLKGKVYSLYNSSWDNNKTIADSPERQVPIRQSTYNSHEITHGQEECNTNLQFHTMDTPLLILFTAMETKETKTLVNSITIRNWAQFAPLVQPVLFLNSTELFGDLATDARNHGWDVLALGRTNEYGTPVFKDMFMKVRKQYQSTFHGYSNGDILFDESLPKTLLQVRKVLHVLNSTMLVGVRKNINMTTYIHKKYGISPLPQTMNIEKIMTRKDSKKPALFCPEEVAQVGYTKRSGLVADAMDYFLVSNHPFPWFNLKDVVIGRPAYDNYFQIFAKDHKVSTIDASKTINAVHQTGRDGNLAGAKHKDTRYNRKLIGKINYSRGVIYLCKIYTYFKAGNVMVAKRVYKNKKIYDTKEVIV